MKTLLIAGLAGIFAMAPGAAIAAADSAFDGTEMPVVDISFASATALATPAAGAKTMPRMGKMRQMKQMGGGHRMKKMGNMRQMKHMRGARQMKRMGNMRRMRGNHQVGQFVREGRRGFGRGYRKPHRGFQLPRTFVQPSFFIGNFGHYGLSQPAAGYGWSRYYDDAVLTDRYGVVQDARYNVDWDRYNAGYQHGYRDGQVAYDPGILYGDDRVIASPSAYRDGQSTYRGDWDGEYREDGSYQGEWQGTYRDADGRIYEGEYSGTFIGGGNMAPHWGTGQDRVNGCDGDPRYCGIETARPEQYSRYPADRDFDSRRSEELAYLERCKKSSGIGGAVVGGAIGALAGNRIAGRGNRLGGSLIGGGLGAVAGAAIEQGTDRCRSLLKKYGYEQRHTERYPDRPPVQYHRPSRPTYPSGWNGYYSPGYYYPQAQPTVTTIVIQSAPVTTTTTTTYVEEEIIHAKPTYKKRWKPATKKVWKAAPVKGCQQERCMYD